MPCVIKSEAVTMVGRLIGKINTKYELIGSGMGKDCADSLKCIIGLIMWYGNDSDVEQSKLAIAWSSTILGISSKGVEHSWLYHFIMCLVTDCEKGKNGEIHWPNGNMRATRLHANVSRSIWLEDRLVNLLFQFAESIHSLIEIKDSKNIDSYWCIAYSNHKELKEGNLIIDIKLRNVLTCKCHYIIASGKDNFDFKEVLLRRIGMTSDTIVGQFNTLLLNTICRFI